MGRTSDAIKVRGMFVVARQAEQVILGFGQVARFQLVVSRKGERDELLLRAELKDENTDRNRLSDDLNAQFQKICRVRIDRFEFPSRGHISDDDKKIIDERTWK